MTPIPFTHRDIFQLREMCPGHQEHLAYLAAINATDIHPKLKKQAFRNLLHCSGPCWIEPEFHLTGLANVSFEKFVFVNHNVTMLAVDEIFIGSGTFIAPNAVISTQPLEVGEIISHQAGPIFIGKNVWIGANAVIHPGVRVEDNAIVGAGAVVINDVPANTTVIGAPSFALGASDLK